jgi:hypothetical protein
MKQQEILLSRLNLTLLTGLIRAEMTVIVLTMTLGNFLTGLEIWDCKGNIFPKQRLIPFHENF